MKKKHVLSLHLLPACLLMAGSLFAQTHVDPPAMDTIGPNTEIKVVTPTNTFYGTRGLTQTGSAEALGEGRLIFGLSGSWYQQAQAAATSPNKNANLLNGIGAVSFGVSPYIDLFASMATYGSTDYTPPATTSNTGSGLGSLQGGIQGTLPFDATIPIRVAAQAIIVDGLSSNQIDTYRADGYDYLDTRTGLDFIAKLLQTVVFGDEDAAFKLHVNEGIVTSTESGRNPLLLLATGLQFNTPIAVLGLELNSRTLLKDIAISTDPLWVTPSVQFRTPYSLNITLGSDISLSQNRSGGAPRALEPYRPFAGLTFSFDTQADKRRRMKEKEQREAMEKARLQQNLGESQEQIAADQARQKASSDSLMALMSKSQQDSIAAANKARQDSINMANKGSQDSAALASKSLKDSLALASEISKRSDAEKQLLSTGLLLLDAVYFETGKTDISINSKPYLNIIAKMLLKYPALQIEVSGYTDNVGGADYNMNLSQGRANAVQTYMVSVAPGLSGNLTAKGYGLNDPKASNSTADGRKLNRRTELHVTNKDALKQYNP